MKPTLLLLLTAMSCVAQTNIFHNANNYATGIPLLSLTVNNNWEQDWFIYSTNRRTIYIGNTNMVIKCTPGLSPIISKDTNGLWTVEFRKE